VEESKEEKLKREREAREAEQRSEFEQIQEARKLLPMFPYRCGAGDRERARELWAGRWPGGWARC